MPLRSGLMLIIVLSACETPIEINVSGDYTPVLVVDGDFNPDSVWSVEISKSIATGNSVVPSELFIQNAIVSVLGESGQGETLVHTGMGVFRSQLGTRPAIGEIYRLDVISPGFESVSATSSAPRLVSDFLDIQAVNTDSLSEPLYRLRFSVTDLPGKSYYRLWIDQVVPSCLRESGYTSRYDDPEGVPAYQMIEFESPEPSFYHDASTLDEPPNALIQYSGAFRTPYFSDRLFEDSVREFELFIQPYIFESEPELRFRLVVSGLSEELVLHERSFILQDEYLFEGDPIFGNPINIFSNVQGGLGIFSGYTNNSYRINSDGTKWTESEIGIGERMFPPCN